jgi:hypothetical protein
VIDLWIAPAGDGKNGACFLFLPSLAFTWIYGQRSYGLTLAWLRWSLTVAWGKNTRP